MTVTAAGGVPVPAPPVRLAVLGDPLRYTRSPELHRAGLAALGLAGDSEALPTPRATLPARLAELAERGFRGVNLTMPLKEAVLPHLARVSAAARAARSVNTVGFDAGGWWGDTTDGPGLLDLLAELERTPSARDRVVMLGAGGAARSLAGALLAAGVTLTVSARRTDAAAEAWRDLPAATIVGWRSAGERNALGAATLVIHATPLGGEEEPAPLDAIAREALLLDLIYAPELTPWVRRARTLGLSSHDGLGLLVHQARRSLALWFGTLPPLDPLARAVGWPR
jgi:shikimate dehydrogenase